MSSIKHKLFSRIKPPEPFYELIEPMNKNLLSQFTNFSKYLLDTGFLQKCVKDGKKSLIYGPAGFLLRKNIEDIWWQRMVTKTEACFPVTGKNYDIPMVYHNILEFTNRTLPFSIAQISPYVTEKKSIIPDHISPFLDLSGLTNLKIVHFCAPASVNQTFDQITDTRLKWWKQYSGNSSRFSKEDADSDNGYPCFHLNYNFPWGQETIETVLNKGEEVTQEIQEKSNTSCVLQGSNGDCLPQCIETELCVDTAVMVYLYDGLAEKTSISDDNITKQTLMLHPVLAPYKVAVTQHGTKERQLREVSTYLNRMLRNIGIQTLSSRDTKTSTENQISRYDSLGVPFTVIVTDETLKTGAIELRNRDTTIHETLAINKLEEYVVRHLNHQR